MMPLSTVRLTKHKRVFTLKPWLYARNKTLGIRMVCKHGCGVPLKVNDRVYSPLPEIAQAIPLTYFLEYFRSFYGFNSGRNLLGWGFGEIGVYLVIEAVLFKIVLHRARRTGILIKLSE